jgi:hypothetical protein
MAYLLDTCAISEFTRPKPSRTVEAWFATLPEGRDFVSVLTIGELEKGIASLTSSRRRTSLEKWFGELRDRLAGRVLPIDDAVALEWGRMSARAHAAGAPLAVIDSLIAATAIVHGLTVVTRNVVDMVRTGVPIIDPWHES